jgi:hypothetical protein
MNKWLLLLRDIFLVQLLRWDGCGEASTELCPGLVKHRSIAVKTALAGSCTVKAAAYQDTR